MTIIIRELKATDKAGVIQVANALPEWFDSDARTRAIPIDLRFQNGFVAEEDGWILGFITLYVAEGRVYIGWLGVHPDFHRKGIGKRLVGAAESFCQEIGVYELATHTLGDSVNYAPYESTQAFYYKIGFSVFQRSQTDNPGCPEEIKIRKAVTHQDSIHNESG